MRISRRQFIKGISAASLVTLGGKILPVSAADVLILQERSALRFVVASDGHFGQKDTEYVAMHHKMLKEINNFHKNHPLDFCVINGDLIHDDKSFLVPAKGVWDKLPVKYYVTKGNHDLVSDEYWKQVWGMPVNHEVVVGNNLLLFATTSNEKGEYLSPDLTWMKARLDAHANAGSVFVFIHIPQTVWNKGGIETPAFFDLMKAHKNIRAV
ncbi:MAG: metallophosphoesterase, partial [Chryseolinea sp.]